MIDIKDIPDMERPRERLEKYGARSLSNTELIAILLRTGTKKCSVLDVANDLLMRFNNISDLNEVTINELMRIVGVGKTKAIELLAAIELGKRINQPQTNYITISSPLTTYQYVKEDMQNLSQENLVALYINAKGMVINKRTIFVGDLTSTIIHPREIIKWGLKYSCYGMILCHNHPSGDPTPSKKDVESTMELIKACKMFDIIVCDHIIIGKNRYYSFMEHHII